MVTRYIQTTTDLKVNKIDRETFDTLSASQISPQELWFVTSADSVVVDIDKIGVSRDWTSEISALSSEMDNVETQIQELDLSAIQQELSATQATLSAMEEVAEYIEGLSAVADLSAVEQLVDGKRDYDDLTYGGTYDPTDAEGYYGITSWNIAGYKYNGQTQPAFNTATRGNNNPTYGTYWNNESQVIYTSDFSTLYLDGFGNAEPVPITLSLDKTTYEVSFMGTEQQDLTLTANLANADRLALNSQLSAYVPTSQFDLSGLGCTTLNLSGTYEDETTFSYDFVVKEAIQ